ncbi:MAG: RNA polymerase sigma factor [Methyloligellaceae bacterium]
MAATSTQDYEAELAALALSGDRAALENLIKHIHPAIFKISQRFLLCPTDAEDATQEILMKVITHLSSFEGNSRFLTWVYSIASNYLRDIKRRQKPDHMTFDEFSLDLADGLAEEEYEGPDKILMEEEVRIGCTLAMLQCLDDDARMAYTLGEIFELDHNEAAAVMECSNSTFRKRLSRAREKITDFMIANCGIANSDNNCRCSKRVNKAIETGRANPRQPAFSISLTKAKEFPEVLETIRRLEAQARVTAIYRAQSQPAPMENFTDWLRQVLDEPEIISS